MNYDSIDYVYHQLLCEIDAQQQQMLLAEPNILLLAVTKQQPLDKIKALIASGHRFFAENRVQDAAKYWPELKTASPDRELHMIGPLQTNKVKQALALFDVIETVDREKLADTINHAAAIQGKCQRCMIQVNIGEEPQKSGVKPNELEALVTHCKALPNLQLEGLMCIPPADEPPAPYYALMKKLKEKYAFPCLSMGMSDDYQTAIRFGATHLRIGTALMGERHYSSST